MLTAIKQSLKALRSNPARTTLTTLGIIIGISTVIMVLSVGAGFRSLINDEVASFGSNTLFIQTRVPPTTKNRASASAGPSNSTFNGIAITSFSQRDLEEIKQLPNVTNDYGMVIGQETASFGNNRKNVFYNAVSATMFDIDRNTLKEGRFFTQAEDTGAAQVVILGSNLEKDLFGDSEPLNQLVRLGNLNFQVIGVYNPQGALSNNDDSLFMPINTAQKKLLGINYLEYSIVQVTDINSVDATIADIDALMEHNHNITDPAKDDFLVQSQAQALGTFNTIFNGITILLIAIAAISLIVGGVGIMNIMYVVVTERTAEIGLKKALGATNADILNEFLVESILVTLLGGIVGIVFGAFLAFLVSILAKAASLAWTFTVPAYAIIIGVGVSAGIGILFGVLPARSASKLDPIEALRYE
jgi:putative ABC transport system permease protein